MTTQTSRPRWHERGVAAVLVVAIAGSLIALAGAAWVLAPGIVSALTAETADGRRSYAIEDAAVTVTPGEGWSVRTERGALVLVSPDGVLRVRMWMPKNEPKWGPDEDPHLETGFGERLASGLYLRHVTDGDELEGDLSWEPSGELRLEARAVGSGSGGADDSGGEGGETLDRYRLELSILLESVRPY